MADPDYEFIDGFDKYGNQRTGSWVELTARAGEWPFNSGGTAGMTIRPGLYGGGLVRLTSGSSITHDAPATYARSVGGVFYRPNSIVAMAPILFRDSTSQVQCSIAVNASGHLEFRRGTETGTLLASFSGDPMVAAQFYTIAWDVTVSSTAGAAKVWLNGTLRIDITGVDTASFADGYKRFTIAAGGASSADFDHLYTWHYLVGGGTELPLLPGHIIDTSFPVADVSTGFNTSPVTLLGNVERVTTSGISAIANTISLRRVQAETSGDLTALYIYSSSTAGAHAMRAAVYSDNNGAPDALLAQSNSVTSVTTNPQEFALLTPIAVEAGVWYWIGFHNQTTAPQLYYGSANTGVSLARTYASGLPDPMPAVTTGAIEWTVTGKIENATDNFAAITGSPVEWPYVTPIESNKSATVGASDNFVFSEMARESDAIHRVVLKAFLSKSNSDARTVDLTTTVGATTDAGDNPGFTPPTTAAWVTTALPVNPDTGLPWEGVLAGVQHGYRNVT